MQNIKKKNNDHNFLYKLKFLSKVFRKKNLQKNNKNTYQKKVIKNYK